MPEQSDASVPPDAVLPPPAYTDDACVIYNGDCLDVLAAMPAGSVDAVVTDPPYGLGFMCKAWDAEFITSTIERRQMYAGDPSGQTGPNGGYRSAAAEAGRYDLSLSGNRGFGAWCEAWAGELLRVLKPGGHLLAFGGTRTWHRLACAIEDAGFEVRDSIAWLYGSGFPKSLDVSKAIDKAAGAEREVVGRYQPPGMDKPWNLARAADERDVDVFASSRNNLDITTPATPDAERWQGWGTALKPAHEPIVVARKPLAGTVAGNVLAHGTGALNVDACRVGTAERPVMQRTQTTVAASSMSGTSTGATSSGEMTNLGRWPTNVVLDLDSAAELDRQGGTSTSRIGAPRSGTRKTGETFGPGNSGLNAEVGPECDDTGGASRFFPTFRYEAKAPTVERPRDGDVAHPTVKPLDLMRWLVRLVTPPGGLVLDPFLGSGTTAEACVIEGFSCIGIEREPTYLPLIVGRLTKPIQPDIFGGAA